MEAALRAINLASQQDACAVSFNLAGDLMLDQHIRLIESSSVLTDKSTAEDLKDLAYKTLDKSIMYYRMTSKSVHAQNCILTTVKLGRALIASQQLDEAKREVERARYIDCPVDPMLNNIEVTRDVLNKEELIAYTKKRIESGLLYIEISKQDSKFVKILKQLRNTRVQGPLLLKAAAELADVQSHSTRAA